ncbi:lipopolysaccharide biosynthesis protein [Aeromonas sp. S11(2024)]|uniref:lipopolysaccharide biosynthesis protein n=1 Tax=unclassified Aeromonas TaxID=257493 RepID=UPI003528B290
MGSYWKNVSVVFSGAVVAQIIPIIGALFIARIYTPSDYGAYSLWLAVVFILGVIFTLRYEAALALEGDGEERSSAVVATLITTLLVGVLFSAILAITCVVFPSLLQQFSYLALISFIPAGVLLSFNMVLQGWAAADGRYNQLNILRLIFASSVTLLQIVAGMFFAGELTLLLMHTLGLFISFCFALCLYPIPIKSIRSIRYTMISFWQRRRRFPIFSLPADLTSTVTAQLPLIIVTSRFGSEIGGLLALTLRILSAPLGILGKAVLDVFKRYAVVEMNETRSCKNIYIKTFKILCLGSIGLIVGVLLFAEWFFILAFGSEWADAGLYAIWLLPLFALRFVASPLSYTIYIVEKQSWDLVWQVSLLVVTLLALSISGDFRSVMLVYTYAASLMYLIYLYLTYRLSK